MATVYSDKADTVKAMELCQKSLAIQLDILGESHPDVAASYNNIANLHSDRHEVDKAFDCYDKALPNRIQISRKSPRCG